MRNRVWMILVMLAAAAVLPPPSLLLSDEIHNEPSTAPLSRADQEELDKLTETMGRLTDIATKTMLNADYIPGMVTVLLGDELETLGVRTVGEALMMVPGVHFSVDGEGFGKAVVRGAPKYIASGNLKVLLDGVSLTTAFGIDPAPNMLIEQVERIEVIRGPGSAIYGEFATAGVINIITRDKGSRIYGALARDDVWTGGAVLTHESPKNDFKINLNLAGMESEGSEEIDADPSPHRKSRAKTDSAASDGEDRSRIYRSGLLRLDYKGFSLQGSLFSNEKNDIYDSDQWSVFAEQALNLHPSFDVRLKLGAQRQTFIKGDEEGAIPVMPWTEITGSIYDYNYDESLLHGGIELVYKGWDRHRILLKWSFARSTLHDVSYHPDEEVGSNFTVGAEPGSSSPDGAEPDSSSPGGMGADLVFSPDSSPEWVDSPTLPGSPHQPEPTRTEESFSREHRMLYGFTIQDEFRIDDRFTLTAGLRFDHYNDIGAFYSPRIAAVYRLNRQKNASRRHILKAQYAHAFRPSTFLELLVEPEIDAETIDTYEVGYIHRRNDTVVRATLFYSRFETRIEDDLQTYAMEPFRGLGGELEFEHPVIARVLKMNADISYVDAENRDTGEEIPGAWNWLGNVALTFRPYPDMAFAAWWRLAASPTGEPAQDQDLQYVSASLDLTVSLFNLGIEGLTLRAGVKNLFEENIVYTSARDAQMNAAETNEFFPGDNRTSECWWWVKASYEF